jgi:hypothetical protein
MKHMIYNTLIFGLLTAATAAVLFSIGVSLGHAQSSYLYNTTAVSESAQQAMRTD